MEFRLNKHWTNSWNFLFIFVELMIFINNSSHFFFGSKTCFTCIKDIICLPEARSQTEIFYERRCYFITNIYSRSFLRMNHNNTNWDEWKKRQDEFEGPECKKKENCIQHNNSNSGTANKFLLKIGVVYCSFCCQNITIGNDGLLWQTIHSSEIRKAGNVTHPQDTCWTIISQGAYFTASYLYFLNNNATNRSVIVIMGRLHSSLWFFFSARIQYWK